MTYKNSGDASGSENKGNSPSDHAESGLGERISEAAKAVGTRKSAASIMGCSTDSLARYIRGDVEPPFSAIRRLAVASGKSLEWIAFGSTQGSAGKMNGDGELLTDDKAACLGKYRRSLDVFTAATSEVGYEPSTAIAEHLKALLLKYPITAEELIPLLAALKSRQS